MRARLWMIFTPPSGVGQDIASAPPFRDMSKVRGRPAINRV